MDKYSTMANGGFGENSAETRGCWNQVGVQGDKSCPELPQQVHCRNCPVYAKAATRFFNRDLPPGYQEEWTRHLSQKLPERKKGTQSVFLFRLGKEWLGLPTGLLREALGSRPIHSLPHRRNQAILGVVNVGGTLTVCVSLHSLLSVQASAIPSGPTANLSRILLVEAAGGRFAFPVDEAFGVCRYHPHDLKQPPATMTKMHSSFVRATWVWNQHMVGILDETALFAALNQSMA